MRCAVATGPQRGTFIDEETGEREPGVLSCRIGHADFSETLADALHGHWLLVEGLGEAPLPVRAAPGLARRPGGSSEEFQPLSDCR